MADANRNYILDKMRGRIMTPEEFDYDALTAPPLYSLLTPDDIAQLHKLATSIRYAGRPIERMEAIDKIMTNRGFRKMTGGTNRVVYKYLENDSFVVKVATDAVGVDDNPREFINQFHYKPFVTKVFEVSPCGTVGLFERVIPITSREEFLSVADDVYELISTWLTGEYVMDDIGSDCFMNYGIRAPGFGVVLLDFPYSYKLDGNKLYCNSILENGEPCGGVIDYDAGYNHLCCTKCGRRYRAIDLKKAIEDDMVIEKGGTTKMIVSFEKDGKVITNDSGKYMDTAPKFVSKKKKRFRSTPEGDSIQVSFTPPEERYEWNKPKKAVESPTINTDVVSVTPQEPVTADPEPEVDDEKGFIILSADAVAISDLEEYGGIVEGESKSKGKYFILLDKEGELFKIGKKCVLIDEIVGRTADDVAIISPESLKETEALVEKANNRVDEFINKVRELEDEIEYYKKYCGEDLTEQIPWYYDKYGVKRYKSNHNKWTRTTFNVDSPFIPKKSNKELEEEIEDKKMVEMINRALPDDDEDLAEDLASVPVGAIPPKLKQSSKPKGKRKR